MTWRSVVLGASVGALGFAVAARAEVELAPLFANHAVLQRDRPVPVWGHAIAGEEVSVTFRGRSVRTVAGADGHWEVTLPALRAHSEGADFVVTGRESMVTLHDVVVGDVWLCSGQSNMAFPVNRALDAKDEIAAANFPLIRQFFVRNTLADQPAFCVRNLGWQPAVPANVGWFTAVGYFFARNLHAQLDVPIGIVNSSFGGTEIEAWMTPESLAGPEFAAVHERYRRQESLIPFKERMAAYTAELAAWQRDEAAAKAAGQDAHRVFLAAHHKPVEPIDPKQKPSTLFNGMIHPLAPYALRGIVWYQGESNAGRAEAYRTLFPTLITSWRQVFGDDALPFFWVQLANFHARGDGWPRLREAQSLALALPHTGQAISIDIGDNDDIHPRNKQEVGRRLALIARAQVYGENIEFSGPVYDSMQREGDTLRVHFTHADSGLVVHGACVGTLEVAGPDRVFHPAVGRVDGETLVVSCADVKEPEALRYAFQSTPHANLYNGAGLPAAPFRTDRR